MSHRLPFLCLLCSVIVAAPAVRGADEDPAVFGKKLSAWMKLLENKDAKERRKAVLALRLVGAIKSRKVVPALLKTLREDADEEVRRAAALAIGSAVSNHFAAARKLEEDLPRYGDARDALASKLKTDKSGTVRAGCAEALGVIGPDARGAVGALAAALKDKHADTRYEAAEALRRIGKDADGAVSDLQAVLADKKEETRTRRRAALALGHIGSDARDALPTLKEVLADEKAEVALQKALAAGKSGAALAKEKAAAKEEAELRKAVAESLGRMGRTAGEAAETLAAVLTAKHTPRDVRLAAVTTLDGLAAEAVKALPGLIKAVKDTDRTIRCLAMHAIGTMGKDIEAHRKNAIDALWKCLRDPSIEVRVSAAEALGALGPDGLYTETTETLKRLAEIAKRDGSKTVREAAQAAYRKIDPKKKDKDKEKDKDKD
jgi:HEAT repeat protein